MKKYTYITSTPDIMGGTPVIAGTRIPIEIILYRIKEGYALKDIHDMYRHVSIDKLQKVIEEIAQKLPASINDKALLQT
jgi:uncharacterized protein (DUF433 family)